MSKIFDAPAGDLIEETAKALSQKPEAKEPPFAGFVKTGSHTERAPSRKDWWHMRLASMLYRAYKSGVVGTGRLRTHYGGRKARGVRPHVFRKSGGKIIRVGLQTLEKMGLIQKAKKGRAISPAGEQFLNQMAVQTMAGLQEKRTHAKMRAMERARERKEREAREKTAQAAPRPVKGKEHKSDKTEKKTGKP